MTDAPLPDFLFAKHGPELEAAHGPACLFCAARRENDRMRASAKEREAMTTTTTDGEWEARYEESEKRRNARARAYADRYPGGVEQVRADYRTIYARRAHLERELERVKREEGRSAELVRRAAGIDRLHADDERAAELVAEELAAADRARTPYTFDPFGDDDAPSSEPTRPSSATEGGR